MSARRKRRGGGAIGGIRPAKTAGTNYYRRTAPPETYNSPTDAEIKEALERASYKGRVSLEFTRDLANIAAGGSFCDPSAWFAETDEELNFIKTNVNVQEFIKKIDFSKVDGNSPLEKAISVVLSIKATGADEDGEIGGLPVFESPQEQSEKVSNFLEAVKDFSDFEREMLEIKQGGSYAIAKLSNKQSVALAMLSKKLKKNVKFQSRMSRKYVRDVSGTRRYTMMTEFSQVAKMRPLSQAVMPTYDYKLATKQLQVVEKMKVLEQKQLLFLLIDQSGSMNVPERIGYILAVVLNRLEAVKNGTAELYISLFDEIMSEPVHIGSESDARDFFDKFRQFRPKGDGTRIDDALRESVNFIKEIKEKKGFAEPQIAIVTDGEDAVTMSKHQMGDITLNYIAVVCENENLKSLAISTGGAFIHCT